jgi:hypothetical protein
MLEKSDFLKKSDFLVVELKRKIIKMNEELELILIKEIEALKAELAQLKAQEIKEVPIYLFSKMTFAKLHQLFNLKINITQEIFDNWFNNNIELHKNDIEFFTDLIHNNSFLIESYKEEDLKVKFITPILNRIKFLDTEIQFRDFYEEKITYQTSEFILTGQTDFLIAKGLESSEKPYFFIQEFKKSIKNDDPRPQLLAELIAAVELNNFTSMRGAYIVGAIWNFVILKKLAKHKYQYFVSRNFDSTDLEKLKDIYKNLLFVKKEIKQLIASEIRNDN